jgi:hypothetical protein
MKQLVIAFSPEGPTDVRFLREIIRRTATELLSSLQARGEAEVLDPIPLPREKGSAATKILQLSRDARGYHCLVIHADADHATPALALTDRIQPGRQLVAQEPIGSVCPIIIPLIPVHMTEAWMLADPDALLKATGTPLSASQLNLPNAAGAERKAQPKAFLEEFLRHSQAHLSRKRDRIDIGDLYALLSDTISSTRLNALPSYQQFKADFSAALTTLGFL